ncbi:nitrate- and nitrite sensing domain-containing protein [Streptomyces microflavus]
MTPSPARARRWTPTTRTPRSSPSCTASPPSWPRRPRRAPPTPPAPLALGGAVEQASATRGLLLAALAVPSPEPATPQTDPFTGLPVETEDDESKRADRDRDELSAAAQQSRVRELASLAEFDQAANPVARDKLSATVTGPEVNSAEKYLTRLTDRPELSGSERNTSAKKLKPRSPPGSTGCAASSPPSAPPRSSAWRGSATTTSPPSN